MSDQQERVPSLEALAEDYARKVGKVTNAALQDYLHCGWVRSQQIINLMTAAGLLKTSDSLCWFWTGDDGKTLPTSASHSDLLRQNIELKVRLSIARKALVFAAEHDGTLKNHKEFIELFNQAMDTHWWNVDGDK